MSVRARRTRRSHEIIIPRSGGGGRYVNPTNADEVFAEHGVRPFPLTWRRAGQTEAIQSPMEQGGQQRCATVGIRGTPQSSA